MNTEIEKNRLSKKLDRDLYVFKNKYISKLLKSNSKIIDELDNMENFYQLAIENDESLKEELNNYYVAEKLLKNQLEKAKKEASEYVNYILEKNKSSFTVEKPFILTLKVDDEEFIKNDTLTCDYKTVSAFVKNLIKEYNELYDSGLADQYHTLNHDLFSHKIFFKKIRESILEKKLKELKENNPSLIKYIKLKRIIDNLEKIDRDLEKSEILEKAKSLEAEYKELTTGKEVQDLKRKLHEKSKTIFCDAYIKLYNDNKTILSFSPNGAQRELFNLVTKDLDGYNSIFVKMADNKLSMKLPKSMPRHM